MKIVAVVSAKGGVGKTTVSANLCAALRQCGAAVVALDFDPQNALRLHFGVPHAEINGLSRSTLAAASWINAMYDTAAGVQVIPYGSVNEADRQRFEHHLEASPNWLIENLQKIGLTNDHVVVIDTPPGPSVYMQQALRAASVALVVVLADPASYATVPGMEVLLHDYCYQRPDFLGSAYLLNQVDASKALNRDIVAAFRAHIPDRILPTSVHFDQGLTEALAYGQTVFQYAPHSQGAHDILTNAQWLVQAILPTSGRG
ncbi:cellulose biosynthesis protein BcsQ [Parvibium lacunae]|uniref:Cellulose synthase operon protein YhjQ n=1 Tax=Parvibium lacunae TaxID=1888893 RepID=A0A368L870_9BURK|nr:cellulose biosynthesis protein BcsQ [Parvibium lacunae]RCS59807.1 cellulose synthase operon protein YhjQ [Parvibium lacunae]